MKLGTAHQGERDRTAGRAERPEVPGYRILERLGGDGRVEVWKAEGPGGFHAALRIIWLTADVTPDDVRGLELLRRARHPNLLAAFGSWRIGGALVLATELPDRSLWDRLLEAQAAGEPGIPRDELIDHLAEAARGIDYVNGNGPVIPNHPASGLGMPHGEITPRTILFVGGGIKVADIDAVRVGNLARQTPGGPTPLWGLDYAAPERFSGRTTQHSDQYSLALTYCHLRLGRLPFPGPCPDVAVTGLRRIPDLSGLLPDERPAVARALIDDPGLRWPSCCAFIQALRADILAAAVAAALEPESFDRVADPFARRPVARASALTLAVATSAATLAGALLLVSRSASPARIGGVPVTSHHRGVAIHRVPGGRFRLQDPAADPPPVNAPALPGPGPESVPPAAPVAPAVEVLSTIAAPAEPPTVPPIEAPAPSAPPPPPPPAALIEPAPPIFGVTAGTATILSWLTWTEPAGAPPSPPVGVVHPLADPIPGPRSTSIHLDAPESLSVEVGRTATLPVTIVRDGVSGPVEVRFKGLPEGVSAMLVTPEAGNETSRAIQVQAAPNSPEGETLARLIVKVGESRAETKVRLSIQLSPALTLRRRADALLRHDDFAAALAAYTESIALDPTDPLAFHGRGLAAYGKGDLEPALTDIATALRLRPDTPTALNNLGLIRLAKGDNAAAIADFDEAIKLDPAYAVVRYNRGRAYSETGAADKALADFDESIRLDPRFAKAYKARADVLSHGGDRTRALADYDEAVRLRPDDPATLNNRGLLLFARGEHHRAIADFDEAIRTNPRYAVVRYNRGRVYAYLGDTVEALASFEQALRLDPTLTRATQARTELLARIAEPSPRPDLGVATRRDSLKPTTPTRPPQ